MLCCIPLSLGDYLWSCLGNIFGSTFSRCRSLSRQHSQQLSRSFLPQYIQLLGCSVFLRPLLHFLYYTPYLSMGFTREQLPTNSSNARKISTGVPVVATMSVPRMLTCVLFCTGFQEFLLRRCPDSIELCWVRESTHVTEVWKEVFHMKTSE
jgi:hypothetical protein